MFKKKKKEVEKMNAQKKKKTEPTKKWIKDD